MGHSVGATMAWQVGMSCSVPWVDGETIVKCEQPLAIVGVEGIYDFPTMVDRHKDVEIYREFVEGALGKEEEVWGTVSPARWGRKGYLKSWAENVVKGEEKVLAVLAHTRGDDLVEWGQVDDMERSLDLKSDGDGEAGIEYKFIEVEGKHHEVWEKGRELARVVTEVVERVAEIKKNR